MENKTISQLILDIQEQICDKYCKYPNEVKEYNELLAVCENCPLSKI